jgi:mono/diheme cytochrome c family protein
MCKRVRCGAAAVALLWCGALGAQPQKEKQSSPRIVAVESGATLYRTHCASCHGEDGEGRGPVAEALTMRPTDLTALAQRNGGKFPSFRVRQLLGGSDDIRSHGTKRMPVWGMSFLELARPAGVAEERINRLLAHLESMQAPPPRR